MSQSRSKNKINYEQFRAQAAIAALNGLLSDPTPRPELCRGTETCAEATARIAVENADALISILISPPKTKRKKK